jgi:uncharacterized protein YdeI (YjbR/CyaY-like superfamily)
MGVPTGWRKHQRVLRRVEVHRPLCGHPHWFSEPAGQIEFGGDRFLLVLEPGDGGPLRHAPTLSTGRCQRAPVCRNGGTVGTTGYRETVDVPELLVADTTEWRTWLRGHHSKSQGVWLVLAKKGTTHPTTLSYDEALDEAICFGWIDGQLGRRDNETYRRRFTPRIAQSPWSQRNVAIAERLSASGRMHRSGEAEVRQAKADGRWNTAYAGQASVEVPEDLADALIANPRAQAMFQTLTSANRYSILYRIGNAKKLETRTRRIEQFVEMLARGETIHPQGPRSPL